VQLSEGSAFFILSKHKSDKSIATIDGIKTLYKPKTSEDIFEKLMAFLKLHNLTLSDIDVTLMGFCGNQHFDKHLNELLPKLTNNTAIASFKNLCGEFYTASAFAMWVATKLIQKQQLPQSLVIAGSEPKHIKQVLIINQYGGVNYSFMLVSQC
jgi:hypothetical protein